MAFSLLFMSLLLGLNTTTGTAPVPTYCDSEHCEHSTQTFDYELDSNLVVDDISEYERIQNPSGQDDEYMPVSASASSVNYTPSTSFNTTNYFTNLKKYSPINNIGSCGYVSLIQLMSFYDTFYNDLVIPEQYEYKTMDATNEAQAKAQSPGVLGEYWSSTSATSYFEYSNSTLNYNLQSRLTVIDNIIDGTNNSANFQYSIGAWTYQNVLNSFYGNTTTVTVIKTENKTQSQYIQTIKSSIDNGDPVVVHINNGGNGGGHSVVAYDYDESGIYAHYGWGGSSSTYKLFSNYNNIYFIAQLDYSSLKHAHSNNYIINGKGFCGCNLSDEIKLSSGGNKLTPPTLYWMEDLYNPSNGGTLLIRCKNRLSVTNPLMILGYVFVSTNTNSITLTSEQWSAIWDLGGHNYTISFERSSSFEVYASHSTTLEFLGIETILDLNEADYGFEQHYKPSNTTKAVTKNNITFNTNRLRCGHINDTGISQTGKWYIVLSANKAGAGTAYLSYDFNFDFNMIDIDLSFWASGEGLNASNGTAVIEYQNASGSWVTNPALDLLNDVTMQTNRTNPDTYTVSFPNGTRSFRIKSTVNNPSGINNKARICIGDLILFNR